MKAEANGEQLGFFVRSLRIPLAPAGAHLVRTAAGPARRPWCLLAEAAERGWGRPPDGAVALLGGGHGKARGRVSSLETWVGASCVCVCVCARRRVFDQMETRCPEATDRLRWYEFPPAGAASVTSRRPCHPAVSERSRARPARLPDMDRPVGHDGGKYSSLPACRAVAQKLLHTCSRAHTLSSQALWQAPNPICGRPVRC